MAASDIEDDASIQDAARLLRRVPPNWVADGPRPEKSNFEERSSGHGLSVTLWESQADLDATVAERPEFGVIFVTAGQMREAGFSIVRVPIDGNPNHCECYGAPTPSKRRKLAVEAKWVKVPVGFDPEKFGELATLDG